MLLLRVVSGSVILLQHRAGFMICAVTKVDMEAHDPADFQEQGGFLFGFLLLWYGMDTDAQLTEREGWGRKPPENSQNAPGSHLFPLFFFLNEGSVQS